MSNAESQATAAESLEEQRLDLSDARRTPVSKMGFWIFIASESTFFASLIGTYLALHGSAVSGPKPMDVFNIPLTTISTFDLLMSSLMMVLAVAASREGRMRQTRLWLGMTALLGAIFLGFQAYEFTTFVGEGLSYTTNIFASSFYTLTGFHGAHVAFGVAWLLMLLVQSFRHGLSAANAVKVEVAGLYWHFVDVVWIVIFTVVYLFAFVG